MRFIIRFAVLALVVGLALGVLLRTVFKRRRFALFSTLSLLPVAAHAAYLFVISLQAGLAFVQLLPFVAAVLVLLVVAALLARRWIPSAPLLTAFTPGLTALVYALVASLMWSFSLEATGVVPNAVTGAGAGLASLAFVATLLVFVPAPAEGAGKLRFPWRRP